MQLGLILVKEEKSYKRCLENPNMEFVIGRNLLNFLGELRYCGYLGDPLYIRPCYSECSRWMLSIDVIREIVRKAECQIPPLTNRIRTRILTNYQVIHRHIKFEKHCFRTCILSYLEVKCHDICNLL